MKEIEEMMKIIGYQVKEKVVVYERMSEKMRI